MESVEPPSRDDIMRSNRALREWANGLREWSRRARDESHAQRERGHELRDHQPPAVGGLASWAVEPRVSSDPNVLNLEAVQVSELFTLLVDQHGFAVMEAVQALAVEMAAAGYAPDHDEVSAADALAIVESALRRLG